MISPTSCRNDYVGNGSTATYTYNFLAFELEDLLVSVQDLSGNVTNPAFTATGIGSRSGGTVTLSGGNLTLNYKITIRSARPLTQESDIRNQSSGYRDLIEDTMDGLVMNDQQLQEQLTRSVQLAETTIPSTFNPTLPADIAGSVAKVPTTNGSGNGWDLAANWLSSSTISGAIAAAASASTSATAAATSASAASTSATAAATSATAAAGSATAAAASASSITRGNLTDVGTDGITVTGGTNAVIGSGTSIAQQKADSTHNGYLSSGDWSTFNSKQAALTIGNLTDAGSDGITVTGGNGSVIGSGTSLAQQKSDATHNGYLSSTDWSTFNGKGAGTVTAVSIASANGFAGTSSGGATPALTISTSITGVLKGNGTAISLATSGTDYSSGTAALATGIIKSTTTTGALSIAASGTDYAPATSGSAILKGNGSGGFSSAASGTDYAPATSGTAIQKGNGSGGFSAAAAGTDFQAPISTNAGSSHQFVTAFTAPNTFSLAQPAFTDISGSVAATQLPNPSSSTLGGVQSAAAVSHQWINAISTSGVPALSQPAFTDISGTATVAQTTISTQAISAASIDWSTGNCFTKTLGANTTFTFTGAVSGQVIVIRLTNTVSNYTVTWPSAKWNGGAAPTMTIGAVSDVYTFFYDGTNYFGSAVQNMS